jgi:hypothetical protein
MSRVDELYVVARRVLLDAFVALGLHRGAIVLVGAHAVYLRVGEADLAVAAFTTDADLAIDPAVLAEIPPLEQTLIDAGFSPKTKDTVGIWIKRCQTTQGAKIQVAVELLVPASVSPRKGRRAARLPGHDLRVARIVRGLEGAIVDVDSMQLTSLETADTRVFDARVAGPAALLLAKIHKIDDRHGSDRRSDKDALDVLRLLRGTRTSELVQRYKNLLADTRSVEAARIGQELLERQFAARGGIGVDMAVRSVGPLGNPDEIAASCVALTQELLVGLKG